MTTTTHYIPIELLEIDRLLISRVRAAFRIVGIPKYQATYSLGFSGEGVPARREYGGPLVFELFGWLCPEPVVVAAHAIPDERPVFELAIGDRVEIEAIGTFVVTEPNPNDWVDRPRLEVVA